MPQLSSEAERAAFFLAQGCKHVLLKGGHGSGTQVVNRWFTAQGEQSWQWPRLPGEFHGSGCTLASALAGQLALGRPMREAMQRAQAYCQAALEAAYPITAGQWMPQRAVG